MRTKVALNAATFVSSVLLICGTAATAQITGAPSGDVAIGISEGTAEYCLDFPPSDITLRLPIRLRYGNHRPDTVYLPRGYNFLWQMTVAGQSGSTILRRGGGGAYGLDVKSLMALSRPEDGPFWIVAGGNDVSPTLPNLSVLKIKDSVDDSDFVMIPVLDRSSGLDLRGKTIQIATTRDFRSIPPEVVERLNEKWKSYGIVWAQVVESDTLILRIPERPLTRKCPAGPLPK